MSSGDRIVEWLKQELRSRLPGHMIILHDMTDNCLIAQDKWNPSWLSYIWVYHTHIDAHKHTPTYEHYSKFDYCNPRLLEELVEYIYRP